MDLFDNIFHGIVGVAFYGTLIYCCRDHWKAFFASLREYNKGYQSPKTAKEQVS